MQRLILPNNHLKLTAGYKNTAYEDLIVSGIRLGRHYGIDFTGTKDDKLYSCGDGTVVETGTDNVLGNYVIVKYEDVEFSKGTFTNDLVARFFHLAQINIKIGDKVNKDTIIGYIGSTGKYVTGKHCHMEFDTDTVYHDYTPTLSANSLKLRAGRRDGDTTVNPLDWLFVKVTAPDYQSISRNLDEYSTDDDINLPILI